MGAPQRHMLTIMAIEFITILAHWFIAIWQKLSWADHCAPAKLYIIKTGISKIIIHLICMYLQTSKRIGMPISKTLRDTAPLIASKVKNSDFTDFAKLG